MTDEVHNYDNQFYSTVFFCRLHMFRTNLVVHHQESFQVSLAVQFMPSVLMGCYGGNDVSGQPNGLVFRSLVGLT